MKIYFFLFFLHLSFVHTGTCQTKQNNYLLKTINAEKDEFGVPCGYLNLKGDTIIPIGKYAYCFSDTLKHFAIVLDQENNCIAIDRQENILFEVYWFDNGPDFFSEGLFRIIKDGKIGFADRKGQIIITPQFECATPFNNGKSKVTYHCNLKKDGEHTQMESNTWFFIDKAGNRVE
ncbi:MAG: WG repeat-containing protein [Bacteroidales bacterium]|nr:WG repeat-containing protein [Bacteroidales bacterium]